MMLLKESLKVLVLEDNTERLKWFKDTFFNYELSIAMTAETAGYAIMKNEFDLIFIDHDLADETSTGLDFAKVLAEEIEAGRVSNDPSIYIHSMNPIGAKNIKSVLKDATIISFIELIKNSYN